MGVFLQHREREEGETERGMAVSRIHHRVITGHGARHGRETQLMPCGMSDLYQAA